jgi:hypothetical protein
MSEVKHRRGYVDLLEEFPNELQKPVLRLIDVVMERTREEFAVRREDIDKLTDVIAKLAEAQKRTEERVEEFAQVQTRFEKLFDVQIGASGSR